MEAVLIRSMNLGDWQRAEEIYESVIATRMATFETKAPSWEDWDSSHLSFSRLVAKNNDYVTGWAALSPVSGRWVYGGVAEVSIYVDPRFRGRGIGMKLLKQVIKESEDNSFWTLQAGLFTENIASLQIHLQTGFRLVGKREKIGKLHNVWKDNFILEKRSTKVGVN